MTYDLRLVAVLSFGLANLAFSPATATWHPAIGISETDVRTVKVHPANPTIVFAGTVRGVYLSRDAGKNYRNIGRLTGVNDVFITPNPPYSIYAATDHGLYVSRDEGGRWNRLFAPPGKCLAVLSDGLTLYLGTSEGLWLNPAAAPNWSHASGQIGRDPIYQITQNDRYVYVVTSDLLYGWDKTARRFVRLFSSGGGTLGGDEEFFNDTENAGSGKRQTIRYLAAAGAQSRELYLATSRGLFKSHDDGARWQPLAAEGVPLSSLTSLLVFNKRLMAATYRGAFIFEEGRWTPLYTGMQTSAVHALAHRGQGKAVYAATEKGVFYLSLGEALPEASTRSSTWMPKPHRFDLFPDSGNKSGGAFNFTNEPTIRAVHRWAIDYAEVAPEKIINWRRLAQKRAWLPSLDIGFDGGRGWDRADSIYGTSSNGGFTYVGPDHKSFSQDFGWDVSLSWDLSDLIWSTDQTTIDSRSKLMVELREDILDQVTRVYFERRRLQVELAGADELDPALRMDKELRVEELTALLDGFTGGKFTRSLTATE